LLLEPLLWEEKLKLIILAVLPFFSSILDIFSFDILIGLRMLMALLHLNTSEESISSALGNAKSSVYPLMVLSYVWSSVVFLEDCFDFFLMLLLDMEPHFPPLII